MKCSNKYFCTPTRNKNGVTDNGWIQRENEKIIRMANKEWAKEYLCLLEMKIFLNNNRMEYTGERANISEYPIQNKLSTLYFSSIHFIQVELTRWHWIKIIWKHTCYIRIKCVRNNIYPLSIIHGPIQSE